MAESKSDQLSENHKEEGNKEFRKGNQYRALVLYNKAICYAVSKECLALGYANRSAVYLELKKYDECLQNIQWARENNYPEDKIQKLNEREEKCKQLKAAQIKDSANDPWNFFKLSHPPNPKIPFIVDCLEMKVTEKYGRGIYATRDISTGDIISIEDPIIRFQHISLVNVDSRYNCCVNCLKSNMLNLIPCLKSASLMFCSVDCRVTFRKLEHTVVKTKLYFDIEEKFGSREKLLRFLKSNRNIKKMNYSVFDFDWNDTNDPQYGINQIKSYLSQKCDHFPNLIPPFIDISTNNKLIDDMLAHAGDLVTANSLPVSVGCFGVIFSSLIKFSCISNVQRVQVDNKILYYATKPIKKGEELIQHFCCDKGRPYHFLDETTFGRRLVLSLKGPTCDCLACKNDWGPRNGVSIAPATVNDLSRMTKKACDDILTLSSLKPAIDQWKVNNKFINENHGNILSKDVHIVKKLNLKIISEIANAATYPCKTEIMCGILNSN